MPFSAMLDGHRVDLVGDDTNEVWSRAEEVKREGRLRCKGCDGELRLRAPVNKSRHFFHLRRTDHCPLSGAPESEAHLRAKKAVAVAIRRSGGTAEIEWVSPGRTFVADVLAEWSGQSGDVLRVVFEVQVSSQTRDRTFERDAVREAMADCTVWVLMASPSEDAEDLPAAGWMHWSNEVTSILLAEDDDRAGWWADRLDGPDPCWSATSLTSLVGAISRGAVFLAADSPWQRGGWVSAELSHQRHHQIEKRQQQEETDRRARELHKQHREAFSARAKEDLDALEARLIKSGHKPRVRRGGPMYGHAVLVTAGDSRYAVMPVASQVWSGICRSNLAATTVIASDASDRQRLGGVQVAAVAVSDAVIPQTPTLTTGTEPPSGKDLRYPNAADFPPSRPAAPAHSAQLSATTRKQRRRQRAAVEEERAEAGMGQHAEARLKRRKAHLRHTASRLGYTVGSIAVEEGWVVAEIDGVLVLTGPPSSLPPAARRPDSVVWSDTADQAARLAAEGWATIASLSALQVPRPEPPNSNLNTPQ